MDNMNKGIKFDFSKTEVITNKLRWIKTLKEVFCINLRDAKDAVDCGSYFYDLSRFSYENDAINFLQCNSWQNCKINGRRLFRCY